MTIKYLQLQPGSMLPDISLLNPFRAIVIIEEESSPEWQSQVSNWLVTSGCLYMMAWGKDCNSWDDSMDYANLDQFDYGEIPDEKFVMTTWHKRERLTEVFWYSKNCAIHPTVELSNTLILHLACNSKEQIFLSEHANA
jgi:hypothetical protein